MNELLGLSLSSSGGSIVALRKIDSSTGPVFGGHILKSCPFRVSCISASTLRYNDPKSLSVDVHPQIKKTLVASAFLNKVAKGWVIGDHQEESQRTRIS